MRKVWIWGVTYEIRAKQMEFPGHFSASVIALRDFRGWSGWQGAVDLRLVFSGRRFMVNRSLL